MAKRRAGDQIWQNRQEDSSSGEEEYASVPQASIAQRKIAVPRKRATGSSSGGLSSTSFRSDQGANSRSNPFASLSNGFVAPTSSGSGIFASSQVTPQVGSTGTAPDNRNSLRLRALNNSFSKQISKALSSSPSTDWSDMCKRYLDYAKSISTDFPNTHVKNALATEKTNSASSVAKPNNSSDISSSTSKLTSNGFKFGGNKGVSTFQFGDKKVSFSTADKAGSGSDSASAGGFKFNPNGKSELTLHAAKPTNSSDSSSDDEAEPTKASITSKLTDTPKDKTASVGDVRPAFSFGTLGNGETASLTESKQTPFTFGKADSSSSKPVFSFGSSSNNTKPAFTFALNPSKSDGANSDQDNTSKMASAPKEDETNEHAKNSQPVFSFGNSTDEKKPGFTFGSLATKGNESVPKFSFGEKKPLFSFGSPSPNKSGLTFGNSVNPFGKSAPASASVENQAETNSKGNEKIIDPATNQDEDDGNNDPQVDLGGPGPGEENEEAVYEKRAKAYELVDSQYTGIGLGQLRVLKNKDTGKVRALLRAEGSGRVILNVSIRKEFTYSTVAKGKVKVLDVKPGETKPTVYLIQVKTEEDGKELHDVLESHKN